MTLTFTWKENLSSGDAITIELEDDGEVSFEVESFGGPFDNPWQYATVRFKTNEREYGLWKALLDGLNRHGDPTEAEPPLDASPAKPMGS